jgi:hypothetical protein
MSASFAAPADSLASARLTGRDLRSLRDLTRSELVSLLPAMGYGDQQVRDLEATIDRMPCDVVIVGTPIDLSRILKVSKPVVRARYELHGIGQPDLAHVVDGFLLRPPVPAPMGGSDEKVLAAASVDREC